MARLETLPELLDCVAATCENRTSKHFELPISIPNALHADKECCSREQHVTEFVVAATEEGAVAYLGRLLSQ